MFLWDIPHFPDAKVNILFKYPKIFFCHLSRVHPFISVSFAVLFFLSTFVADFGDAVSRSGDALKRESGENPEQTRCCKLILNDEFVFEENGETRPNATGRPGRRFAEE